MHPRKTLLATLILVGGPVLSAEPSPSKTSDLCTAMDVVAKTTMEARQAGAPMIELYKKADAYGDDVAPTLKPVIQRAYKEPLGQTDKEKAWLISEFRNAFYMACIEAHPQT